MDIDPEYVASASRHGTSDPYSLELTVAEQTFKFEGPTFPGGLSTIFQAWLNAVGPTMEAQALIDQATAKLKASTDKLVEDVTASTPATA